MITAMNHITLAVTDIDKSFLFYRDLVGLKPLVKWDKGAYFFVMVCVNSTLLIIGITICKSLSITLMHLRTHCFLVIQLLSV